MKYYIQFMAPLPEQSKEEILEELRKNGDDVMEANGLGYPLKSEKITIYNSRYVALYIPNPIMVDKALYADKIVEAVRRNTVTLSCPDEYSINLVHSAKDRLSTELNAHVEISRGPRLQIGLPSLLDTEENWAIAHKIKKELQWGHIQSLIEKYNQQWVWR